MNTCFADLFYFDNEQTVMASLNCADMWYVCKTADILNRLLYFWSYR